MVSGSVQTRKSRYSPIRSRSSSLPGELSRCPRRIPQSDATRRESAWRWACSGCGHRSGRDRSKRSASLRFLKVVDFFLGNPEVSQDLIVWNGLVMLRPFARFRERLFLFCCDWFVVDGSVREGPGEGIEHGFEEADNGGELRRRKPLDQFVGLLLLVGRTVCHKTEFSEIYRTALG